MEYYLIKEIALADCCVPQCERVWPCVGGCVLVWEGVPQYGRVCPSVGGCGRYWYYNIIYIYIYIYIY